MPLISRCLFVILLLGSAVTYLGIGTDDPAIKEFDQRVKKYAALHKKIEGFVPTPKKETDPNVIVQREKEFANALRVARPEATQGDIFIPSVRPIFLKVINDELMGPAGKQTRAMILGEGNPTSAESPVKVKLAANAPYPSAAPLSTVPPSLLLKLPPLPEAVEYRFVGRNLILWDTKANLVVDILPDVIS